MKIAITNRHIECYFSHNSNHSSKKETYAALDLIYILDNVKIFKMSYIFFELYLKTEHFYLSHMYIYYIFLHTQIVL